MLLRKRTVLVAVGLLSVSLVAATLVSARLQSRFLDVPAFAPPTTLLTWEGASLRLDDSVSIDFARLDSKADSFIAVTEVTTAQFAAFVAATRYRTVAEREGYAWLARDTSFVRVPGATWRTYRRDLSPSTAVALVAWVDAMAFAEWLTVASGRRIRLPTSAEWRQACIAARYPSGGSLLSAAWSRQNASATQAVATRDSGANGVYDLLGNVWEWLDDAPSRRSHLVRDFNRPLRGGSWMNGPSRLTCDDLTTEEDARIREPHIGFRVVAERGA